mmetsp:Transcript_30387/g.48538  ORF Transcript_30387/g.48538 Transcript_30387/m.48538 type:complete len:469 (-) Transcript_30387:3448-4854(-)
MPRTRWPVRRVKVAVRNKCKVNAFRQMHLRLLTNTYLNCMRIIRQKKTFKELGDTLSQQMEEEIDEMTEDPDLYSKLARSIAPEIYGLEDIKKALLLMLVGGVTKKMKDGMCIRGDINICLMGDPGVAKSQLLKHVTKVAPRAIYTTGKGSSGVGLTAAVTRDKSTGETALEGGALVLADMGICCIDEFDKMEDADRTAIHEVMEQQTVSIAKAGVTTTLNARTCILAAANPIMGRWNKNKSPEFNINLPAALLSRFDLMFLMLDVPDVERDKALAKHITHVHRHAKHPELDFEPFSPTVLRAYLSQARKVEPFIPVNLTNMIVHNYVTMRQSDHEDAKMNNRQSMLTARQLLSILRMAQALARIRFDEEVSEGDVHEAIRLVNASRASVNDDDMDVANNIDDQTSRIFGLIRDTFNCNDATSIDYTALEQVVTAKGFRVQALDKTLAEYEAMEVIQLNASRTRITLV